MNNRNVISVLLVVFSSIHAMNQNNKDVPLSAKSDASLTKLEKGLGEVFCYKGSKLEFYQAPIKAGPRTESGSAPTLYVMALLILAGEYEGKCSANLCVGKDSQPFEDPKTCFLTIKAFYEKQQHVQGE